MRCVQPFNHHFANSGPSRAGTSQETCNLSVSSSQTRHDVSWLAGRLSLVLTILIYKSEDVVGIWRPIWKFSSWPSRFFNIPLVWWDQKISKAQSLKMFEHVWTLFNRCLIPCCQWGLRSPKQASLSSSKICVSFGCTAGFETLQWKGNNDEQWIPCDSCDISLWAVHWEGDSLRFWDIPGFSFTSWTCSFRMTLAGETASSQCLPWCTFLEAQYPAESCWFQDFKDASNVTPKCSALKLILMDEWVLASSTSISHHIPLNQIIPGDGADFEKEARAAEMRARPHYQAGRKDSHALKLYRYAARPHVQVDTDRAWSRIKFSQYESRLALWKLTLKFQPRRSIWNGLPGPIRTTFGRSLRLAEFFWFDLHTMCIQCALPIFGWCEAPFLDMGTCKVQGPKRFKLETLAWDYVQKVSKSKWRDGFWRFAWTLWSHGTIPV